MKKIIFLLLFTNLLFSQCWKTVDSRNGVHNIGIQTDGSLWTWGYNLYGQLGDGTNIDKNIPTQIGTATDWKFATASENNSFAIKTNGTLWAWGNNESGQLGNGTTVSRRMPIQIGSGTDWLTIASNRLHVLALKTNGTLWAWGRNQSGELGNGTTVNSPIPVQIGTDTNWVKIEASVSTSFAIKANGTLWSWGDDMNGTNLPASLVPVQVGTDSWTDISATWFHAVALKSDGTIWAWGENDYGQLGNGNNNANTVNQIASQIGTASNWKSVSAGTYQSLALKTNGTLWVWGNNNNGQFGNNTTVNSLVPTQSGTLTNWKSVVLGQAMTIGLKTNNDRLWVWGSDLFGALGNGSSGNSLIPLALGTCSTLDNEKFVTSNISFKIYPNPTNDFLQIENLLNFEINEIEIINVLGKVVINQKTEFNTINLQNLDKGIYFLSILSIDNNVYRHKIMKN